MATISGIQHFLTSFIKRSCHFFQMPLREHNWIAGLTLFLWGVIPIPSVAQINNAGSPIVFSGGNSIDTATISAGARSTSSKPDISNPVQILGTGGSLIGSSGLSFLNAFTGPGNLTLNLGSSTSIQLGYTYYPSSSVATFSNGFTMQSGEINFRYGTSIVNGEFSVTGNSRLVGKAVFTSNTVTGAAGKTLNGGATFAGAGPNFIFDSDIVSVISTNTSGTQVFGGTVSGGVQRRGHGGTSVFSSPVGQIVAYGGTVVLSGSNGSSSNSFSSTVFLDGGSVVLDNTLANNNSRISGTLGYYGGDLTLLGVNGGSTAQNLSAPAFSEGLNRIKVVSGSGAGSSASLSFGGQATYAAGKSSVDFEGLNNASKIFFSAQTPGAIGAWATVDGTEFASYDSVNGVQSLSAAGRPAQISTAPADSYVLGSGTQAALTANLSVVGVTMPTGASLDLGGRDLTIGGWIQNGSAGSIFNGIIKGYYVHFTTNSDLTANAPVDSTVLLKNGPGTLTLNGSYGKGQCYVNAGTLALNLGSAMGSIQGQSTFVVGKSAGEVASATLSLLGDNQFISNPANVYNFVGVQVQSAGQFKLNGHNATVSFLQVNGGVVDMGGATVSTGNIYSYNPPSTGQIKNGTLQLIYTSNAVNIGSNTYQDALAVSSRVLSSGILNKTGPGILVLSNVSNSFGNGTLGLLLTEGTVALANSGACGSANQLIQFDGGGLRADSVGALVLTNPVTGNRVVTSGSDMTFSGGYRQTGFDGEFHISNTLLVNSYAIDGSSYYSSKTGTGTLILAGVASGTTTGSFTQRCGTLRFGSNTPLPSGMILKYWGGMLEAANGTRTISNKLLVSDDITFAGSQDLKFNASSGNAVDPNQGIVERRFYINGTGRITINNLTSQSSTFTKAGPGTLVVSGNPSGFAATRVNEGTLRVKNSDATGAVLGAISVNNQGILGGTGIVKGLTTVVNGGALDPGDAARSTGSLNFKSGLTLNSGSSAHFDLGATTGNDLIQITAGTLTASASGLCTLHLYNSGDFGPGTYTLIAWTNSSTALASQFALGTVVPGYNYNLFVSGNSLCVSVTAMLPLPAFRSIQGLASDGSQDLLCPAGDGSPNLFKYAFNMLGSGQGQAASLGIPNAAVVGPSGTAGLPAWTVDVYGLLNVTYIRRKSSSFPGITCSVEFADSLSSWAVNPLATESVTSIDNVFERVILTDSAASTSKRFGRVRITTP